MIGKRFMNRDGMTLIEVVMVCAIGAMVLAPTAYFISRALLYFEGNRVRSQLLLDANACQHTIRKFMQLGSAKTLAIDTLDTSPASPPYSHATFKSDKNNATTYDIRWATGAGGRVMMVPGGSLATNVQSLSFVVPDPSVPTQVLVTVRLSAPVFNKYRVEVQLTNQLVEMRP